MKKQYLECGKVCSAHGVRGAFKVEPWCDSPKVLAGQKRVFLAVKDGEFRECRILTASVNGPLVLMTVEGIDTREKAIAMKNTVLYLKREDIPVPEGEMLLADMIGIPVIDADTGKVYGSIKAVDEVPRGLLYTVETENGDVLFPSVPEFIEEISPDGMLVRPIPGFFD